MKAVLLTGHGGLDKLQFREDVEVPVAQPGEVLIRVNACGLNNTDINTRTAWYSKGVEQGITEDAVIDGYFDSNDDDGSWGSGAIHFPVIQGADVCGAVASTRDHCNAHLIGKRVMVDPWFLNPAAPFDMATAKYLGSEINGGYAEYIAVPASNVHLIESSYSNEELATFACAYGTADNLIERTGLTAGETIVISGASGGVGSAAIQLAKIRAARVIAISSQGKEQALLKLGADHVVNRNSDDLKTEIRELANGEVDVAVDVVGGDTFTLLVDCLRQGGRYSSSGCIAGPMVDFDLRKLIYRDLQLTGATVIPPGSFARLVKYIEREQLKPVLAESWPLRDLAQAQQSFMKKTHIGKIVVTI
ncbi:MAG: NADPH:quinone reductase-like Zn-dependent oxidoreductase [Parasphingorhabdus sp.]|jgi:NADPH:quinone reductase-like Zn-dependent oxidoreductase